MAESSGSLGCCDDWDIWATSCCGSHYGKEMMGDRGVGFLDSRVLTVHVLTRGYLVLPTGRV